MPPLLDILKQMAVDTTSLPWPAQIILFLTNLAKSPLTYLIATILIVCYFFFVHSYFKSPKGKLRYDKFRLTIPIFGKLRKKLLAAQFCHILSTLLSTGVPVVKSLEILQDFSGNDYFKQMVVIPLKDGIKKGQSMSAILEKDNFLPSMMQSMMAVGETSGEMPRMLARVSDFYNKEVIYTLKSILNLVEPIMVGSLGMLICFILLSVLLPLYQAIISINA